MGILLKDNLEKIYRSAWLELAMRWFLGAMFVYASLHKIIEPAYFAKILYGYYLFPANSINLIAIILPYVELFSGLALVLGIYPRSGTVLLNILLFAFIIALSINVVRGQEFDCGCFSFGKSNQPSSAKHLLVRDIIYFVMGLYVLFYSRDRKWCIKRKIGIS
jgi:putative oxidoreductase